VQNLDGVHPIAPDQLNTYDVLNSDDVVFSVEALNTFIHGPAESVQEENKEEAK
jgi:large subunit ribosomal protein L4